MTIHRLPTTSTSRDFASIQDKIKMYQRPLREWAGHLNGNELAVLGLLIDRTVGWGRREAHFTIRALINGDGYYSGINISRSTAFRVLKSLEGRGIIRRRQNLNVPDRVHFTVIHDWMPRDGDPISHQDRCHDDTDQCQNDTTQCQADTLITGNQIQVSNTGNLPGAAAPVSLEAAQNVRAIVSTSSAANLVRSVEKVQTPQSGIAAVDAAWQLALIETFPGTAYRAWGVREKAQIKTVLKNWSGDVRFPFFVDWGVRNWTAIIKKHFKWMTKEPPPATPALSFLIRFIDKFADARAEGVLEDWLSAKDRTELEKMMGRGMTWEQATVELGKTKAAVALREEMEKREIKVRARDYGATRKLAQAARLAELEGRVPIHPNSPLAKQMREAARPVTPIKLIEVGDTSPVAFEVIDLSRNPFDG